MGSCSRYTRPRGRRLWPCSRHPIQQGRPQTQGAPRREEDEVSKHIRVWLHDREDQCIYSVSLSLSPVPISLHSFSNSYIETARASAKSKIAREPTASSDPWPRRLLLHPRQPRRWAPPSCWRSILAAATRMFGDGPAVFSSATARPSSRLRFDSRWMRIIAILRRSSRVLRPAGRRDHTMNGNIRPPLLFVLIGRAVQPSTALDFCIAFCMGQ
jgi:hypothetical protein